MRTQLPSPTFHVSGSGIRNASNGRRSKTTSMLAVARSCRGLLTHNAAEHQARHRPTRSITESSPTARVTVSLFTAAELQNLAKSRRRHGRSILRPESGLDCRTHQQPHLTPHLLTVNYILLQESLISVAKSISWTSMPRVQTLNTPYGTPYNFPRAHSHLVLGHAKAARFFL